MSGTGQQAKPIKALSPKFVYVMPCLGIQFTVDSSLLLGSNICGLLGSPLPMNLHPHKHVVNIYEFSDMHV